MKLIQICEMCRLYGDCPLPKRDRLDPFMRCDEFSQNAAQPQYDRVVDLLARMRQEAASLRFPSPADFLPGEFLPPDMYLAFKACDFGDEVSRAEFEANYAVPCEHLFHGAHRVDHPGHARLMEIQAELGGLVDQYMDDPEEFAGGRLQSPGDDPVDLMNAWLARLKVQLQPYAEFDDMDRNVAYDTPRKEDKWFWWRTAAKTEGEGGAWRLHPRLLVHRHAGLWVSENQCAILFAQFANDILSNHQELRRCPSCEVVFRPRRRRDAGATCGQQKCKNMAQRRKAPTE